MTMMPCMLRSPSVVAASIAASGKKYMSFTHVTPPSSISWHASSAPSRTNCAPTSRDSICPDDHRVVGKDDVRRVGFAGIGPGRTDRDDPLRGDQDGVRQGRVRAGGGCGR